MTAATTSRNARLAAVRLALHSLYCRSAQGAGAFCTGVSATDHAKRTQHQRAVSIVDAQYPITAIIVALHEWAHPTCETPPDEDHFPAPVEHPAYVLLADAVGVAQ